MIVWIAVCLALDILAHIEMQSICTVTSAETKHNFTSLKEKNCACVALSKD